MVNVASAEVLAVVTAQHYDATPTVTTLRVAIYGGIYDDPDNSSYAPVHYDGRIRSDLVVEKAIGLYVWNKKSSIDFGYLDIAVEDQHADYIDFASKVTVANVDFYLVDMTQGGNDQIDLIASARSSDIGFSDENTIRIRLESSLQYALDSPINDLYYDYTYPHLEGKPYPIAWGLHEDPFQLLPTVFVDDVYLLYHVTDVVINTFESVAYDRGIALNEGSNFTATDYGFTLNQNPDGKITCGQITCDDPYESGVDLLGLYRIMRLVTNRASVWDNVDTAELSALETDINMSDVFPSFVTDRVVSLDKFLNEIFAGVGAFFYFDELAEIHFGRVIPPEWATFVAFDFTDDNVIGEIKVEDDKAPKLSTRMIYGVSEGAYDHDELAGDVSNEDRLAMTNKDYTVETSETVLTYYQIAKTRDPIPLAMSVSSAVTIAAPWTADTTSFTADATDHTADGSGGTTEVVTSNEIAQRYLDRWFCDIYPKRRRFYTFDVRMNDPVFDFRGRFRGNPLPRPSDFCTLQSDRFKLLETAVTLLIRRAKFNYSTGIVTIEGWG